VISTLIELNAANRELTYLSQWLEEVTKSSPNSLTIVSIQRMMSRIEQEISDFDSNSRQVAPKEASSISGAD